MTFSIFDDLLKDHSQEDGGVSISIPENEGDHILVTEELTQIRDEKKEDPLTEKLDHADKAQHIADRLDELQDKAQTLADEDHAYAQNDITTECMHREYLGWVSSLGLEMRASSFEAESNPVHQLNGLSRDIARTRRVMQPYLDTSHDYSAEGWIMQVLRRDEKRLEKALDMLEEAGRRLKAKRESISKGVTITNNGIARFMTVENRPTISFIASLNSDIKHLDKIDQMLQQAARGYQALASNGRAPIPHLDGNKVMTRKGELLGNRTITPEFKYADETSIKLGAAAIGGVVGLLQYWGWGMLGGMAVVGVGVAVGAPLSVLTVGVRAAQAAAVAIGVKGGKDVYNALADAPEGGATVVSKASADDLINSVKIIEQLHTKFKREIPKDLLHNARESVKAAGGDVKALESSFSQFLKLADAFYEHGLYLTVNCGILFDAIAKRAK